MMKFSNNYVAEMLTKNLANQNNKQPQASMDQGLEEIRRFLDGIGWERKNYTLTSPSGLSRKNRFRAKDVHALLEKLRLDSLNFPEYLSAQAVAGTDGTLRNRMKGETVFGRVRGKTGTLSGVAGLAGYVLRKDGEVITFAFLFNGGAGVGNARKLFDRMAISLSR